MRLVDFREIWCVDTEFIIMAGERPSPVCICAVEARSGEQRLLWFVDNALSTTPIPLGEDVLYDTYSARAEFGVHLVLGWSLPANVLDLHVEHLRLTNGRRWETCKLTSLRRQLGLSAPADDHKEMMRQRILQGPPFTDQERDQILAYCLDDARMLVEPLQLLFGPTGHLQKNVL
jgi:hypothetical protein